MLLLPLTSKRILIPLVHQNGIAFRCAHEAVRDRGVPKRHRCEDGPELAAKSPRDHFLDNADIEPGSPWENSHVEPFNSRHRDLLNIEMLEDYARLDGTSS